MPIFESKPGTYDKIPVTSLTSSHKTEQRILNTALTRHRDAHKSPIIRLSMGKSVITYFKQRAMNQNNRMKSNAGDNAIDPNAMTFTMIEGLVVHFDAKSTDQEESDVSRSFNETGTLYVLPNTIHPDIGDYFEITEHDEIDLMRVTDVRVEEVEEEHGYAIDYTMHKRHYRRDEDDSPVKNRIYETFVFREEHIGTDYRTLYTPRDNEIFRNLMGMYRDIGSEFHRLFFEKLRATYFLKIDESIDGDDVYASNETVGSFPDRIRDRNDWVGARIYDRELIEFIVKHRIFDYIKDKLVIPSVYFDSSPRSYHKTIFHAIEAADYRSFTKGYTEVSSIIDGSSSTHRMLYGYGDVKHVNSLENGVLTLFPVGFQRKLMSQPDVSDSFKTDTSPDPVDYVVNLINCFLNRKSVRFDHVVEKLEFMFEKDIWTRLFAEEIRPEYRFYMYPLVGYMLSICLSTLSDKNTTPEGWGN